MPALKTRSYDYDYTFHMAQNVFYKHIFSDVTLLQIDGLYLSVLCTGSSMKKLCKRLDKIWLSCFIPVVHSWTHRTSDSCCRPYRGTRTDRQVVDSSCACTPSAPSSGPHAETPRHRRSTPTSGRGWCRASRGSAGHCREYDRAHVGTVRRCIVSKQSAKQGTPCRHVV